MMFRIKKCYFVFISLVTLSGCALQASGSYRDFFNTWAPRLGRAAQLGIVIGVPCQGYIESKKESDAFLQKAQERAYLTRVLSPCKYKKKERYVKNILAQRGVPHAQDIVVCGVDSYAAFSSEGHHGLKAVASANIRIH